MTDSTQPTQEKSTGSRRRYGIGLLIVVIIFSAALALDLHFHGLIWQFIRSQTGEEDPAGQLMGMVEVAGNLIRVPPDTQPLQPISHTDEIPFGINTFLQNEVLEDKRAEQLRMIQAAGFAWIRQEFVWEDIEVDGRGQFTDTRNDYDGDGLPDTVSGWEKYDNIVDLADEYDLRIIARLSNPPAWTRANPDAGELAPPDDLQDYVNFAVATAERYKGRITHYQIWNEPNIFPEWGNNFVQPARYTEMLCRTYDALKQVDPDIVVLSAAIAPTKQLDGYIGYQDLVFLQNMYDNGAAGCFDILSAQGYGLNSGPYDRRLRATTVNYQRHVLYRDIMVANGDAHKSIWLSEAGWNAVLDAPLSPSEIAGYGNYGLASDDQLARYTPRAYQRAFEEWPWIGNISYWFFTRHTIHENNQAFYYFRMAEADYSDESPTFTPLPVYYAMQTYIENQRAAPVLYRGTHQAQSWEVDIAEPSQRIDDADAEFGTAISAQSIQFTAAGTHVRVRYRSWDDAYIIQDGTLDTSRVLPHTGGAWDTTTIYTSWLPQTHTFALQLDGGVMIIDSITVLNRQWAHLVPPLLIAGIALLGFVGWLLVRIVRRRS